MKGKNYNISTLKSIFYRRFDASVTNLQTRAVEPAQRIYFIMQEKHSKDHYKNENDNG